MFELYEGDCMQVMKDFSDKSIDMICCDLPYGITDAPWDSIIPLDDLWKEYKRIIKDNGAIVLFSVQPFTTMLMTDNMKCFKHHFIWLKKRSTGFLNVKVKPMMKTEEVLVFTRDGKRVNYYPQMIKRDKSVIIRHREKQSVLYRHMKCDNKDHVSEYKYPSNVLEYDREKDEKQHPTQKPVKMLEFLIKSYSQPNEIILDNCMGSGSTGVACMNTGRRFIGIEKQHDYYEIAKKRIEESRLKNEQIM